MRREAIVIVLGAFLFCLAGCAPRGETISLDEVFKNAQNRYLLALKKAKEAGKIGQSVEEKIFKITASLKQFVSSSDPKVIALNSKVIAGLLGDMVSKAGFPSRPAMGELQKQYYKIFSTAQSGFKVPLRTRKLLSARTYSLLYRELQTTAFKLRL